MEKIKDLKDILKKENRKFSFKILDEEEKIYIDIKNDENVDFGLLNLIENYIKDRVVFTNINESVANLLLVINKINLNLKTKENKKERNKIILKEINNFFEKNQKKEYILTKKNKFFFKSKFSKKRNKFTFDLTSKKENAKLLTLNEAFCFKNLIFQESNFIIKRIEVE